MWEGGAEREELEHKTRFANRTQAQDPVKSDDDITNLGSGRALRRATVNPSADHSISMIVFDIVSSGGRG